uniref:Uncharacterized protein n=1 Tax=Anguilla anguilla TaxID=7936 RepID=A0A0E9S2R9_ANGAN
MPLETGSERPFGECGVRGAPFSRGQIPKNHFLVFKHSRGKFSAGPIPSMRTPYRTTCQNHVVTGNKGNKKELGLCEGL